MKKPHQQQKYSFLSILAANKQLNPTKANSFCAQRLSENEQEVQGGRDAKLAAQSSFFCGPVRMEIEFSTQEVKTISFFCVPFDGWYSVGTSVVKAF